MAGLNRTYAFFIMVLTMLALSFLALHVAKDSGSYGGGNSSFARCDACHPENADTIKSGEHYGIKCAGCHKISDFQENRHNSTIPLCSGCHSDSREGKLHTKSRHSEPVYNPKIAGKEEKVHVMPANATVQIQPSVNDK